MKFVFAPDSFKGSLSAKRVCELLAKVAARHYPQASLEAIPIADGGEGTVESLVLSTGGVTKQACVTGPMGGEVSATYGVLGDGETAVLEMAQASGLPLVPEGKRNPLLASSYGTGEMIRHALDAGYRKLTIGLGGSATNDGGMGMLTALGARFFDARGEALRGSGEDLERLDRADLAGLMPALHDARITVISDVSNTLLGEAGATAIYGPQKGADTEMLVRLEKGMANYADVLEKAVRANIRDYPGSGAAGGMGAALGGVLKATIKPGISTVLDIVNFDERVRDASLVITGEGKIDGQSIRFGKAAAGVATRCAPYQVPVIAIVGGMADGAEGFCDLSFSSIMTTINGIMSIEDAMENAEALLVSAAERMFLMLKIGAGLKA